MLALEPRAEIVSSTEVNPGIAVAAGGIGKLDLAPLVSQRAVFDWLDQSTPVGLREFKVLPAETLVDVVRLITNEGYQETFSLGLLVPDEVDATRFQIRRRLHIVYPTDGKNPKSVKPGGRIPIVVLVHGQHDWFDRTKLKLIPNHEGYHYLQEELASHGILSVSVDTNAANALDSRIEMRAESVLGALDTLRAMDGDPTSIFYQRLDFERVGMMGHSRGGDAVVRAAIMNAARPKASRYDVKAVCSLAPTDVTGTAQDPNTLEEAHTSFFLVVYGGLDGDVSGGTSNGVVGTGFRHYDRARTQKAMIFLAGCNHNRFNTVWMDPAAAGGDDYWILPADIDTTTGRVLTEAKHQALAKEYIGGLFRWWLLGTTAIESLFDGTRANAVGADVSVQWSFGRTRSSVTVVDDMEGAGVAPGSVITAGSATKARIESTVASARTNHKTTVLDANPATTAPVTVCRFEFSTVQDWRPFDQFTFRVCADADVSSAASVAASALPDFKLIFQDSVTTERAEVTPALLRAATRPVYHTLRSGANRTAIHLETFAVDLASGLGSVNRSKMKEMTLILPASFSRHQFFDSFELIKR